MTFFAEVAALLGSVSMRNVRYNLMRIAYELAGRNQRSVGIIIVSPSFQGKTDTVEIFGKTYSAMWSMRPATPSKLTEQMDDFENINMIVIDDPSRWTGRGDLDTALMLCKNALDGTLSSTRSTSYNIAVATEKETHMGFIFLCNKTQYQRILPTLVNCGMTERAFTVFCKTSKKETIDYIEDFYDKHEHDFKKIRFKDTFVFVNRKLNPDEISFIDYHFKGGIRRTVMSIAKIIPEEEFHDLRPYLTSGKSPSFVEEEIEFEEVKK